MSYGPSIITIKSEITELNEVEKFLYRIFEREKLSQKYFNKVFLCISEAVTNSIEHGNKNDCQKMVSIIVECTKNCLYAEVYDQGEGFNYQSVENPTLDKNIRKEGGRGIYIMKSISNEIEFRDKGKCVKIKIDL